MATHQFVYGHGAKDPGAGANGKNERDFTRNTLGPHLEKYARLLKRNTVIFYDKSKDMYQETQKGLGAYAVSKGIASVTEIHLDSAGPTATGGHVVINKGFSPDAQDLAIANVVKKYVGWWGSVVNKKGISYRQDLLNLRVFADRGISYRLVELGFISNRNDVAKIEKNIDAIAKELIESVTGEKIVVPAKKAPVAKPAAAAPKNPITNTTLFANNSKVRVSTSASKYQTGQNIPAFVKGPTYTVAQSKVVNQGKSKYAFLLKEINSWILGQDLIAVITPATKDWSKDYYTTNPGTVKLLVADGLRAPTDVNFTGNPNYGGRFPAGTVFKIKGIKKRSDGLPRLITQSGFLLTANKKYVQKI